MIVCRVCKKTKEDDEFHWRTTGKKRQSRCKPCESVYHRRYYLKNKKHIVANAMRRTKKQRAELVAFVCEYLSTHPCIDCGETRIVALEFDHVLGKKRATISRMLNDCWSLKLITREIAKCVVRCATCHRIRTAEQFGWRRAAFVGSVA